MLLIHWLMFTLKFQEEYIYTLKFQEEYTSIPFERVINGSQLAKMKKYVPCMSLAWKL